MADEQGRIEPATTYIAPPVQRAARLLRHIAEGDAVLNMSHTAKALGINRTTLLRLLHTLEAERFIERRPNGAGYQLGLGLIGLVAGSLFSQDLVPTALPVLARLADTFHLSSHLGVLEGREVLYLLRRAPNVHLASNIRVGSRLPAHATTMGRMLLAYRPWSEVEALYRGVELRAATGKTRTTPEALRAQLDEDRVNGVAWSDSAFEPGISSFAAPVFDASGGVVAAINVTGPNGAFAPESGRRARIGEAVREAAAEVSERLGFVAAAHQAGPVMERRGA